MDGFGERLKRLRQDRNITQSELAAQLGVVPSAVGKYERIPNAYPSVDALIKIADFFGVSIDYLLRGTKVPPEAMELLHIYETLGGRDRLKLLNYAVELERSVE